MNRHRPREERVTFGHRYEIDMEELRRWSGPYDAAMQAKMREAMRRVEERMFNDILRGTGPFGQAPYAKAIEVITDPGDQRGFSARKVGP